MDASPAEAVGTVGVNDVPVLYVDIFGFYKPGTIDDILVGHVWEFDISQAWALGALVLMTIPSLMVFLSLALPARNGPLGQRRGRIPVRSRLNRQRSRRDLGLLSGSERPSKWPCSC